MPLAHLGAPRAAYLHVPFCAHRCGYCNFTLVAGRDDLVEHYLAAIERELGTLGDAREVDTIFLGGGTPTHVAPPRLGRLLDLVARWFRLVPGGEFSIEANPARLENDTLKVLADHGVNRISLGVQSFDRAVLQTLERDHDERTVADAFARIGNWFENISLDLIFGVPGQSLETWRRTLARAVALAPRHISTYGLTIEKGTAFWSRREKGLLCSLPDELERAMYAAAMDDLSAAGFEQYEISNFSLPGRRCRHNETYWAGRPYYGFGPGAARYIDGCRAINHRSVTTWLSKVLGGSPAICESESLAPEDRARESLVFGLRRTQGVEQASFLADTGFSIASLTEGRLDAHFAAGLIEETDKALRLTREGRFVADSIAVDLL